MLPLPRTLADLVVENPVVVELKAGRALDAGHEAQQLDHRRAAAAGVGLLLDPGVRPAFRRRAYAAARKVPRPSAPAR